MSSEDEYADPWADSLSRGERRDAQRSPQDDLAVIAARFNFPRRIPVQRDGTRPIDNVTEDRQQKIHRAYTDFRDEGKGKGKGKGKFAPPWSTPLPVNLIVLGKHIPIGEVFLEDLYFDPSWQFPLGIMSRARQVMSGVCIKSLHWDKEPKEDFALSCLRWALEVAQSNVLQAFNVHVNVDHCSDSVGEKMWRAKEFHDVVVIADGEQIFCHRAFLAAMSPVFQRMLAHNMQEVSSSRIEMRNVSGRTAHQFLEMLYVGSLPATTVAEDLISLLSVADMYQVPAVVAVCAPLLPVFLSEQNVIAVLQVLSQLRHTHDVIQQAWDTVTKVLQRSPDLFNVVCLQAVAVHAEEVTTRGSPTVEEAAATQADHLLSSCDLQDPAAKASHAKAESNEKEIHQGAMPLHGNSSTVPAMNSNADAIDDEKQAVVLASIEDAAERGNADLAQAIMLSKSEMPPSGIPLSRDGVVIMRLTRKARSREVIALLTESPLLSHCHQRVKDAGCSMSPTWANGAKLFVPLTEEQVQESGKQLTNHHIVALADDVESIKGALRHIKGKDRPKISFGEHKQANRAEESHAAASAHEGEREDARGHANNENMVDSADEDDFIDVVVESEFAPPTDSSLGYPDNPYSR
mmetsp:Transcript_28386/g.50489  ORF Transcript_28386/g.50489 Transcript_28386/m.50489 type:complete len:632 (+) Transcript_28386:78-1973(+)